MSLLKHIIGEIVEFDFGIKLNKEHSITVLCSDSKIIQKLILLILMTRYTQKD